MSFYIKTMTKAEAFLFKRFKRDFKENKPCAICGRKLNRKKMTVDHIIPIWRYNGTIYDIQNLQVLCLDCHRNKNKKDEPNNYL